MDWKEFIAALAGHLVWPASLLAIAGIFRAQIGRMLAKGLLKSVTLPGGFAAEFFQGLEKVEEELESSLSPGEDHRTLPDPTAADTFSDDMRAIAEVAPAAAVNEAFRRLELFLRREVTTERNPGLRPVSVVQLGHEAVKQNLLTPREVSAFQELRNLRNELTHRDDESITADTALSYADLAWQVAVAVQLAKGQTVLDGNPLPSARTKNHPEP